MYFFTIYSKENRKTWSSDLICVSVTNGVGSGGRNNSGGAGGAGGLGLVNLEDQLTQMVTGSDLTSVTGSSSIFTTSAFRSNE